MNILKGIGIFIGGLILIIGLILSAAITLVIFIPCLITLGILFAGAGLIHACDEDFFERNFVERSKNIK